MSRRRKLAGKCVESNRKSNGADEGNQQCLCNKHTFSSDEKKLVQIELLNWYDQHQRKLPWRDAAREEQDLDKRGYAVWISEIMLQQTQVATVIPYYMKWIEKWPTISDLAAASLEEVNKIWAGLGYYSRAKRIHEGACLLSEMKGGRMPQKMNDLKETLPGIGRYTASAISSIAYQNVCGVVDGNVSRVLSRVRAIGCDITKPFAQNHLWKLADDIVSESRPGDFNQALMELGAVICTPRNPKCGECPLKSVCTVYSMSEKMNPKIDTVLEKKLNEKSKRKLPDIENALNCPMCMPEDIWSKNPSISVFPVKPKKKSSRLETIGVVVVEKDDEFLLIQRPETGLLAGLWEFPSVILPEDMLERDQHKIITDNLERLGLSPKISDCRQRVGKVVHIFSHIRTTYVVEHLIIKNFKESSSNQQNMKWIKRSDVNESAISTAMKKVLLAVEEACRVSEKKVGAKKRKLPTTSDSKQRSITSFFS